LQDLARVERDFVPALSRGDVFELFQIVRVDLSE
jgi:hypothetical protein